jgi:hypothetical protein
LEFYLVQVLGFQGPSASTANETSRLVGIFDNRKKYKKGKTMAKQQKKQETESANDGKSVRPTKKQHETLDFIRHFIAEHGYSPSYREIMNGCNYTSVATVSLHVNNLIKRGHIVKRDKSARSLEVVGGIDESTIATSNHKHELMKEIESRFERLES